MEKKGKDFTSASKEDNVYTPYSMVAQLLLNEKFDYNKRFLEPCCGKNIHPVVDVLTKQKSNIDIDYFDINFVGEKCKKIDFLKTKMFGNIDYIITNPPYSKLDKFITNAKEVAKEKFAFLCKLTHLGGVNRFRVETFTDENYPLTKIYLFTRQANIKFTNDEQERRGYMPYIKLRKDGKYPAGMYYFVWLIFEKNNTNKHLLDGPIFNWINNDDYILRKDKSGKKKK